MAEATRKVGCFDRLTDGIPNDSGVSTTKPESRLFIVPAEAESTKHGPGMPEASFESEMPEGLGLMATCFWYVSRPGRLRMSFCQGLVESEASDADLALARDCLGESVERLERLGGGTFGDVHKVRFHGKEYALKEAKNIGAAKFSQMMELLVLKRIMEDEEDDYDSDDEEIVHGKDFVVKMFACDDTHESLPYVMELAEGSLRQVIQYDESTRISMGHVMRYLIEITQGLEYIHGVGVAHNDLKPDNVLLVRGGDGLIHAKVADLGCVRALGAKREALIGTVGFIPLECLGKEGPATAESDVFGAGVIAILSVLRRDLRNHSISFCPTVTTEAENAVISDLLANAKGFGSEEMAAVEMQATRRALGDNSVQEKVLVPGNLHEEVPASTGEWVCRTFAGPISLEASERPSLAEFREDLLALYGLFLASSATADGESSVPVIEEPLADDTGLVFTPSPGVFSSVAPPAHLVDETASSSSSSDVSAARTSPVVPHCPHEDVVPELEAIDVKVGAATGGRFPLEDKIGRILDEDVAPHRRPPPGLSVAVPALKLPLMSGERETGPLCVHEVEVEEGTVLDIDEQGTGDSRKLYMSPLVSVGTVECGLSRDSTVADCPVAPRPRRPPPGADDATASPRPSPPGLSNAVQPVVPALMWGDDVGSSFLHGAEDSREWIWCEELDSLDEPGTSLQNVLYSSTTSTSSTSSCREIVAKCPAVLQQPPSSSGLDGAIAPWQRVSSRLLFHAPPPVESAAGLGNDGIGASNVRAAEVQRGRTLDEALSATGGPGTSCLNTVNSSVNIEACRLLRGSIGSECPPAPPEKSRPPGLPTAASAIRLPVGSSRSIPRAVSQLGETMEETESLDPDMSAIGKQATAPSKGLESVGVISACKPSCGVSAAEARSMDPPQSPTSKTSTFALETPAEELPIEAVRPSSTPENKERAVETTKLVPDPGNAIHGCRADLRRHVFSTTSGTMTSIISRNEPPRLHDDTEQTTQSVQGPAVARLASAAICSSAMPYSGDRCKGQAIVSIFRVGSGLPPAEPPTMQGRGSIDGDSGSVRLRAAGVLRQATAGSDARLANGQKGRALSPVCDLGDVATALSRSLHDTLTTTSKSSEKSSGIACNHRPPDVASGGATLSTMDPRRWAIRRMTPMSVLLRTTKAERQGVPSDPVPEGAVGHRLPTQSLLTDPAGRTRGAARSRPRGARFSQSLPAKDDAGDGADARRSSHNLPFTQRGPPTRNTADGRPAVNSMPALRFVPSRLRLMASYSVNGRTNVRREAAVRHSRRGSDRTVERARDRAEVKQMYNVPVDPLSGFGGNTGNEEGGMEPLREIFSDCGGGDPDIGRRQARELGAAFSGWYCKPMSVEDVSHIYTTTIANGSRASRAERSRTMASTEYDTSGNTSPLDSGVGAAGTGAEQAAMSQDTKPRRGERRIDSHLQQAVPLSSHTVLATASADMTEMISCTELENRGEKPRAAFNRAQVPPAPGGGSRRRLCAGSPEGKGHRSKQKGRGKVFGRSVTRFRAARQAEARLKCLLGIGIHSGRGDVA